MINDVILTIQHGNNVYTPSVLEGITWQTERKGSPGKLEFKALGQDLTINEGDIIRLTQASSNIFFGYVFKTSYSKDNIVSVTAYDQLRYFKNKDSYVYEGKTASDVLRMLAKDFNLTVGTVEGTGYKIGSRIEDNKSLFEIMQNALDITLQNTKKMFVLYDDFGKLTLQNVANMGKAQLLINNESAENYEFKSSIDDDTYNRVKLVYDDKDSGKREVFIAQNNSNIKQWGVLQYFGTLNKDENGKAKAQSLLQLYNAKTKKLSIKNAIGRNGIRAGSLVLVNLRSGNNMIASGFMVVEKCKHEYKNSQHTMNLDLTGGGYSA